jgi:hypothetical protein
MMFATSGLLCGLVLGPAGYPNPEYRLAQRLARIRADVSDHAQQSADATEVSIPRVRSEDRAIRAMLGTCVAHSATLRGLMQVINRTNGIVYLDPGRCRHGVPACLVMSVTVAGPNRVLHIRLDSRGEPSIVSGSLAHELQHAAEALSEPGVTSNALLEAFFERLTGGPAARGQLAFETDAAINLGNAVRREVIAYWQTRHVRSDEAQIAALIAEGEMRSEVFQHLLATLDASDVVVYLVPKQARQGLGGYVSHAMTTGGGYRYIRVAVETQGSADRLIALCAHELQHAVEIAEAREVRDNDALRRFFQRANVTFACAGGGECYETQAAEEVEQTVLSDLKAVTSRPAVAARLGPPSQRSVSTLTPRP